MLFPLCVRVRAHVCVCVGVKYSLCGVCVCQEGRGGEAIGGADGQLLCSLPYCSTRSPLSFILSSPPHPPGSLTSFLPPRSVSSSFPIFFFPSCFISLFFRLCVCGVVLVADGSVGRQQQQKPVSVSRRRRREEKGVVREEEEKGGGGQAYGEPG